MDSSQPLINLNSNQNEQPTDNKSLLPTQGHKLREQALQGGEDIKSLTLKQKLELVTQRIDEQVTPSFSAWSRATAFSKMLFFFIVRRLPWSF